jgi:mannose-1-phosphate guanylyltransferase
MEPPVYIGEGCRLQSGARLTGPVVIGEGCTIGAGAVLSDVLVWSGTDVPPGAELSGGIAGIDSLAEGHVP